MAVSTNGQNTPEQNLNTGNKFSLTTEHNAWCPDVQVGKRAPAVPNPLTLSKSKNCCTPHFPSLQSGLIGGFSLKIHEDWLS